MLARFTHLMEILCSLSELKLPVLVLSTEQQSVKPGDGIGERNKMSFKKLDIWPLFRSQLMDSCFSLVKDSSNREYVSAVHMYYAEKCRFSGDYKRARLFERGQIFDMSWPMQLKRATSNGQLYMKQETKREWKEEKGNVWAAIWELKYSQNSDLREILVATENAALVRLLPKNNGGMCICRLTGLERVRDKCISLQHA